MADLEKIRCELKKQLKKERYIHTIGVMYTAASIAMRYGEDIEKAMTAGLLHDCGKFAPAGEQIRLCKKYELPLKESELEMPALIHAKLGAYLAKEAYKVCDGEILNAILYHTTGRPDMTMLEKIRLSGRLYRTGTKDDPRTFRCAQTGIYRHRSGGLSLLEADAFLSGKSGRSIDPMTRETFYITANRK